MICLSNSIFIYIGYKKKQLPVNILILINNTGELKPCLKHNTGLLQSFSEGSDEDEDTDADDDYIVETSAQPEPTNNRGDELGQ